MDRKGALEKLGQAFEEEKEQTKREFEKVLSSSGEQLKERLYQGIRELDQTYPISIIQFQIMRADLFSGRCTITVCGYDKNWYQDETYVRSEIDAAFLYAPFGDMQKRLEKNLSVYMGAVTEYDTCNMTCEYFLDCFCRMADRVRTYFFRFDEWAEEEGIRFLAPYRIVWGTYRGKTETIFFMDRTGKTKEDLEAECGEEKKRERKAHFYRSFVSSNVKGFHCGEEKFAFLNMKGSRLGEMGFERCQFASPIFRKAVMEWCSFEGSSLFGADFSGMEGYQVNFKGADLRNSVMEECRLRKADFTGASLTDVAFAQGVLEECSFRDAVLCGVDLRAERLEGVDFTGAVLDRVYIWEKDAANLKFTKEQEEHVLVVSGRTE